MSGSAQGRPGRPAQLALDLPLEGGMTRADLIESASNRLAIDLIDDWPDWPSHVVVLAGPVGSGKSHLAAVWAIAADARIIRAADLAQALEADPMLARGTNLVIEDAGPGTPDAEALFYVFNQSKGEGRHVLITSRSFPAGWNVTLPDLASRLKLAHVAELHEPDDALLAAIIVKLFADRQLEVAPHTVSWLVTRMERSMAVANALVAWLDREALARGVRINRNLAAEALAAMEGRQPEG